jgi:ferrous iron transport protein B
MAKRENPPQFPQLLARRPRPGTPGLQALSEMSTGSRGSVRNLHGGRKFIGRMAALGFTPDTEVEIVQNSGHSAVIVAVRGTQVALGIGEAEKVLVQVATPQGLRPAPTGTFRIAFTGQPNAGKSTLFNALTGNSQHTGNWPGKTVELETGLFQRGKSAFEIVDLPGTYSLTANSPEERIARDFILTEHPDVVVDIVDASALERSLYLLTELLALPVPVVLGLNMMDVAEEQGIRIEPKVLEAALQLPVVPLVATQEQGLLELAETIERVARKTGAYEPNRPGIREDHREVLDRLEHLIRDHTPAPYPPTWVALKLLEGDEEITQIMTDRLPRAEWEQVHEILKAHEDAILSIAGGRYEWIARMVRAAVTRPRAGQITITERIDRFATHPVWGLLILLGVLGAVFLVTDLIGSPLQRWLSDHVVGAAAGALRGALYGSPWWVTGVLADGVLAGAGMVLTFLPILVIFFAALGLMEDVGYMARAAYVMDRYMHWMGLHGKSFMPLCLGCGCNVPGVLCARTIDSPRARVLTILLTPLVPCNARLGVLAVLAPLFFGSGAVWVSIAVVALNLALLMIVGYGLHELVLGGEHVAFIMEMPLYHAPNARTIGVSVRERSWEFLRKAGGTIVLVSMLVWALSAFPTRDLETSYLADFGHWIAPAGSWLGLDWRMIVALLTSVVAKENTIATLGVLGHGGDLAAFATSVAPLAAATFLMVQLVFVPCVATVAAIHQETRSWKWTAFSIALLLVISLSAGFAVYQIGRFVVPHLAS